MNTPAHIAASLLAWQRQPSWCGMTAVVAGAALPDLPMFGFYGYQKWIGSTEREIWSHLYFEEHWQLFFDLFNSIPLAAVFLAFFVWLRWPLAAIFTLSALLHLMCDLPVHHDDAHRHFLPLSTWRYRSPVSYWDPRHHGLVFACSEFLFASIASGWVAFRAPHLPMRVAGRINMALYVLGLSVIAVVWLKLTP